MLIGLFQRWPTYIAPNSILENQRNRARLAWKILERCERKRDMTKKQAKRVVSNASKSKESSPDLTTIDEWNRTQQDKPSPDDIHQASAEKLAEKLVGWYDAILNASMWASLLNVKSRDAALLLCHFSPDDQISDPMTASNEQIGSDDLVQLLHVFHDLERSDPCPRTLLDWRDISRDRKLKYHSWIDRYEEATNLLKGIDTLAYANSLGGIPSAEIIEKFRLDDTWTEKLRKPNRYEYLLPALMKRGTAGGESHRWNPAIFGAILVKRKERNHRAVLMVITRQFPEWQYVFNGDDLTFE